ncbi:MAG TPA: 3-dehydroquinate synthase [Aggregatilineales bacterium]|nr:3-dehydroquinate synthase [Anaerolineales bacterium]HRE49599.1 3-dehydroquinate synthase [Aggregatilineales bacterium]
MIHPSTPLTLSVKTPEGAYPIHIGDGLLDAFPALLTAQGIGGAPILVTNTTLAPLYGEALAARLGCPLVALPDGEAFKTLDTVRTLYDAFLQAGVDRGGVVIALGGGVIGDMAGFAAATFLRGVTFVQAPTSLLAMVDASVGGKVGVDLPQGKNLVGAFKQPALVVIDLATLRTLPPEEWRCGVAETIKHGLIADPDLLYLERYMHSGDPAAAAAGFVPQSVGIKIAVVEADPYEHGQRAHLNLGHTFAHAVERVSGFAWRHGEAVGIGLIAAARLSAALNLCEPELPAHVESLVAGVGLPTHLSGMSAADIAAAMETDKKRQGADLRFVLLHAPAFPLVRGDIPTETVIAVLRTLGAN